MIMAAFPAASLPAAPASVIPQGVGAPPPPGMDPKRGKLMCIKVRMLDDTVGVFHLGHKATGQALFDEVCRHLNLLECDYFGLEFYDCYGNRCWLDYEKPILRQITQTRSDARFYFVVKFYTPNPEDLEEEYTRYLFALQVKRDLATGQLPCNDNTAALLASYVVQAECGDYSLEDYPDHTYLQSAKFVPKQDAEFEKKIMDNHKRHIGMSPAEADMSLLETGRRCEMYGVKMHPAKDHEGMSLCLAVLHLGVKVFQGLTCINVFSWAKMRKLSFKKKRFLIKLHPDSYTFYKDTVEFFFDTRNEAKSFWKKCIEHHGFFRCSDVKPLGRQQSKFFSKGSSFRYSGRTQKQLIEYIREHHKRREPFTRPVHSSYTYDTHQRGYSSERSLPTPLLPISTSRFNGNVARSSDSENQEDHQHRHASSDTHAATGTVGRAASPPSYDETMQRLEDHVAGAPKLPRRAMGPQGKDIVPMPNVDDQGGEAGHYAEHVTVPATLSTFAPDSPASSSRRTYARVLPSQRSVESYSSGHMTLNDSSTQLYDNIPMRTPPSAMRSQTRLTRPPLLSDDSVASASQSEHETPRIYKQPTFPDSDREAGETIERKSKKGCTDKAYFIFKELLMNERTYVRDLNLLSKHFDAAVRDSGCAVEDSSCTDLFGGIQPLGDFHAALLSEMEERAAAWEGRSGFRNDHKCIGNMLLCTIHNGLQIYQTYLSNVAIYLACMDELCRTNAKFGNAYLKFETQKLCYLPITRLLLKPAYRLVHYQLILTRLVSHYVEFDPGNCDLSDSRVALDKLLAINQGARESLRSLENFIKLVELERDLAAVDNLVQPNRLFLREGALQRFGRKGAAYRMFFLLSDCLLYAGRATAASGTKADAPLQFKVYGQIPTRGLMFEDGDPLNTGAKLPHCFTIYGSYRSFVVNASSAEEKQRWLSDLARAMAFGKENVADLPQCSSAKSVDGATDDLDHTHTSVEELALVTAGASSPSHERQMHYRSNNSTHVCWHRCSSVSMEDIYALAKHALSGYLLRKFRNSTGWQKLWVIFADFCLFFYKSHTEDIPLASLPLLGYSMCPATPADGISKEFVFKLHYKSHVYFFRAESDYTYSRWMESLRSACTHHECSALSPH